MKPRTSYRSRRVARRLNTIYDEYAEGKLVRLPRESALSLTCARLDRDGFPLRTPMNVLRAVFYAAIDEDPIGDISIPLLTPWTNVWRYALDSAPRADPGGVKTLDEWLGNP